MPRNGSGVYSKLAGTTAVPNTTIESAKYNSTIDDIAADLNLARPIVAGGTGATSVSAAQANLSVDNKVVYASKSGNYTVLDTDNNAVHRYTAAATVTLTAAATLGANWHYTVVADGGAVTIDPNGSETINGAATLTVPNGSSAKIICDGSNFFAVYKPSVWEPVGIGKYTLSAVSSLSITDLGAYTSMRITGYITPSATASIVMRTSTNNGVSYDSGASDYLLQSVYGAGTTPTAQQAAVAAMSLTAVPVTSANVLSVVITGFNQTRPTASVATNFTAIPTGATSEVVSSQRNANTACNAFQILLGAAGTMSGVINIEGIRG